MDASDVYLVPGLSLDQIAYAEQSSVLILTEILLLLDSPPKHGDC